MITLSCKDGSMKISETEKGIEMPRGGRWMERCKKMSIGDSFEIRIEAVDGTILQKILERTQSNILATVRAERTELRVATRKISDGVLRVWRIA